MSEENGVYNEDEDIGNDENENNFELPSFNYRTNMHGAFKGCVGLTEFTRLNEEEEEEEEEFHKGIHPIDNLSFFEKLNTLSAYFKVSKYNKVHISLTVNSSNEYDDAEIVQTPREYNATSIYRFVRENPIDHTHGTNIRYENTKEITDVEVKQAIMEGLVDYVLLNKSLGETIREIASEILNGDEEEEDTFEYKNLAIVGSDSTPTAIRLVSLSQAIPAFKIKMFHPLFLEAINNYNHLEIYTNDESRSNSREELDVMEAKSLLNILDYELKAKEIFNGPNKLVIRIKDELINPYMVFDFNSHRNIKRVIIRKLLRKALVKIIHNG